MHRSRLAGFIIDCQTDDLPAAASFWGGALGMPPRRLPGAEGERYLRLAEALHPGVSNPEVFGTWLTQSPLRASRFLPMVRKR